jgi:hypothetical protein
MMIVVVKRHPSRPRANIHPVLQSTHDSTPRSDLVESNAAGSSQVISTVSVDIFCSTSGYNEERLWSDEADEDALRRFLLERDQHKEEDNATGIPPNGNPG